MGTYSGRNGRITLGAPGAEHIIAEMGNWTCNRSADEIDTTAFGDGWGKSDVGMKKWQGSMQGNYDPTDADGQAQVEAAYDAGSLLQDIRFYVKYSAVPGEQVIYFTPDTDSDPNAGMRVTSLEATVDKADVGKISIQLSGSGPVKRVIETVA
jgi:hypothetical protein